jgi:lysophospholipase L1-like esterase
MMRLTHPKWLILRGVALACMPLLLGASRTPTTQDRTGPQPDPSRHEEAIRGFEVWDSKNSVPENAVLFVGSSSIRLWATHDCFPRFPVINRGFGGSHISDVNHFADRIVLPYKPKAIVFYAGDNDIADGKSPQRVSDDYRRFVSLVHAELPMTPVILIPIKPSLSRWPLWPQMKEANALIRGFSEKDDRLFFADTATPMLGRDGRPRVELFVEDGLHLNAKGYKLWTEILTPFVDKAMNG